MSRRAAPAVAALAFVAMLVAACAGAGASFSPTGPCLVDGKAPGTYPDLEARVPTTLGTTPDTTRDSGRNCTATTLGTLKGHGVTDLRYAGSTWSPNTGPQTVIAVFRSADGLPPLQAAWVQEFYQAGAQASTKTENIKVTQPTISGVTVWRLDTLNDLSFQSVVVLPGDVLVHVVIVATEVGPNASMADHEAAVAIAVKAAAASAPTSSAIERAWRPVVVSPA